jgi:hypothetical protein
MICLKGGTSEQINHSLTVACRVYTSCHQEPASTQDQIQQDFQPLLKTRSSKTSSLYSRSSKMSSTPRAGKRKILDLKQRVDVIKMLDQGVSCRAAAIKIGCGKTQVVNIKSQREAILKEWEAGARPTQKFVKRRKGTYDDVNDKTYEWFLRARAKHLTITGALIQVIMVLYSSYEKRDFHA